MELEISSQMRGDALIVSVRGDVDLATAPLLDSALAELWQPPDRLVIDASGIAFMDSTGLGVLVKCAARARDEGGSVALVAVTPRVRKVLAITGLDSHLGLFDTVDGVLRATRIGRNGQFHNSGGFPASAQ